MAAAMFTRTLVPFPHAPQRDEMSLTTSILRATNMWRSCHRRLIDYIVRAAPSMRGLTMSLSDGTVPKRLPSG